MSLDPERSFVITRISRAEIATLLNDYLDKLAEDFGAESKRFTPDDDRLTDDLCQELTSKFDTLFNELMDDQAQDEADAIIDKFLVDLGTVDPNVG